ncbi:glucosyltransferase domain-containing protein [Acetobacter orleanensis]|nr:glucosyltransferase domain-containing protein [Acetobacter orleanensis]
MTTKYNMENKMEKFRKCFLEFKYEFIFLYLISFIYILPRILSDADYNDDIFRSSTGDAYWWYYNGRPLVVWTMRALNQNRLLADSTPLPVILGMVLFVFCCTFIMKLFPENCNKTTKIILCSAFILNPFFISNFSYKYDSLPMYISLSLAIIVALKREKKPRILSEIPIFVFLLSALCFYQAALNLIISLMSINLCISALRGNINIRQQIYRAITVIFSYLTYTKIIAPYYLRFIYINMSQHINFDHEGIIYLKNNIKTSCHLIFNFYHGNLMHICIISYSIIYFLGIIFIIRKPKSENLTNIWVRLAAYISGIGIIILCALSLTVFLKNPDIQPRVLLGTFGFVISAPLILVSISCKPAYQFLAASLCVIQIIPTLALSFSFGNYLKQEFIHDGDAIKEIEFHLAHYTTNAQTKLTFLNDNPSTSSMNVKKAVHPLIAKFMTTQGLGRNYDWYSRGFLKMNNINYDLDNAYNLGNKFVPTMKTCHVATSFTENRITVAFQSQC